jgi:hypothetical protein
MWSNYEDSTQLIDRIDSLPNPYRENAIEWLEMCTQEPMSDLRLDMTRFLGKLHPAVRRQFVIHTGRLLDTAVHYFSTS